MALVAVIFLSTLMAYNGKRTILSLGVILICGVLIAMEHYTSLFLPRQEILYVSLFLATWYNGNFSYLRSVVKKKWGLLIAKN